ncbi:MAG TPA: radical SAM protein, partial [archaeon]|nr:radical SAM protein [archaeon]
AVLREKGHDVGIVDGFGENPKQFTLRGEKSVSQGLTVAQIIERLKAENPQVIGVYAINAPAHSTNLEIVRAAKKELPTAKVFVVENTSSVVSYALKEKYQDFLDAGADAVMLGELEENAFNLLEAFEGKKELKELKGIAFHGENGKSFIEPTQVVVQNLDSLPFPAYDLLPLENYWSLGYSHGPNTESKYLPLWTSRGCPYGCTFCVTPQITMRKWRPRNAKLVVDEIEHFVKKYNIQDFQVEDIDPTIRKERFVEICKGIIDRRISVSWKIVSGTKVETLDEETLSWMRKAGCNYVSISPETGSKKLITKMNKPFNYEHGLKMVKHMGKIGIKSQACFVLGFPGEDAEDKKATREYITSLARNGVDEVTFFMICPLPGAMTQKTGMMKLPERFEEMHFTPVWREDYKELEKYRNSLYTHFFIVKALFQPLKSMRGAWNVLTGHFETKMEMGARKLFALRKFQEESLRKSAQGNQTARA